MVLNTPTVLLDKDFDPFDHQILPNCTEWGDATTTLPDQIFITATTATTTTSAEEEDDEDDKDDEKINDNVSTLPREELIFCLLFCLLRSSCLS